MARSLNRPAIFLNLAAFVGVCLFCISTEAPVIQQDVLKRCQETLLIHRLPIRGLSVDGRDVSLSGDAQSALLSPRVRFALGQVSGVRVVRAHVLSGDVTAGEQTKQADGFVNSSASSQDIQKKIDRVLENQSITFKTDTNKTETSALTPESELALDKIATYLAQAPGLLCEIRGYDSETAGGGQNWVLALQRALSTEDYLESKAIADWRLSTRAFHPGEGTQGRRRGRAIDFVVRAKE